MKKVISTVSVITVIAAIFFSFFYYFTSKKLFLTLAITFGTTAYHFCIRLLIGTLLNLKMKNKADYTKKWYHVSSLEQKFYRKIQVQKWKNKMPTYDRSSFHPAAHSWDEIAQAMCQSELVHELNVIFSFLPVFASIWVGAFSVFFVTSITGAAFDFMFVIIQRYNRPRILKIRKKR